MPAAALLGGNGGPDGRDQPARPVVAAAIPAIPGANRAAKVAENAWLMAATIPAELRAELTHEQLLPENAPADA